MMPAPTKHTLLLLAALLFTSSLAAAMWFVRFLYTESVGFFFLLWNLFLAWLPVLFALLARRRGQQNWADGCGAACGCSFSPMPPTCSPTCCIWADWAWCRSGMT